MPHELKPVIRIVPAPFQEFAAPFGTDVVLFIAHGIDLPADTPLFTTQPSIGSTYDDVLISLCCRPDGSIA